MCTLITIKLKVKHYEVSSVKIQTNGASRFSWLECWSADPELVASTLGTAKHFVWRFVNEIIYTAQLRLPLIKKDQFSVSKILT